MSDHINCYHCGAQIDKEPEPLFVEVNDQTEQVCCHGCKTITEHIVGSGLSSYYEFRSDLASKPDDKLDASQFDVYGDPQLLKLVAEQLDSERYKIILSIDSIHCAACAWLIEQSLTPIAGVDKISVNTISQRAELIWHNEQVPLTNLLNRLNNIGYPAAPFNVSDTEESIKRQNKKFITRLGVAGLFTMQVMMLAFAMYFGTFENMESHQAGYFKWLSMLLSIPVIFYSALPFLFGCFYSLKTKKLNMDVPVATAIYGAFFASLLQLFQYGLDGNQGEVFFESICMFTFLLLIGKYLEFKAKSKAILANANLNKTIPFTVNKLVDNEYKTVLVQELSIGDVILVKAGEALAVDGKIRKGATSVNESVLNGEFAPVTKSTGDQLLAGSINNDGLIELQVTAVGGQTTLAQIGNLQSEFSSHKPQFTEFADKIAHWFVLSQLVLALLTYIIWQYVSPADALWVSLSVLVATCPCSLSLATPTAYTCVMSALNRKGILIKDPKAFDKLNQISHVAFDKTGTLTQGQFAVLHSQFVELDKPEFIKAAIAKLQSYSEHPIAKAFGQSSLNVTDSQLKAVTLSDIDIQVGNGITANCNGCRIKIGKAEFVGCDTEADFNVYVSLDNTIVAKFFVSDRIKPEACTCIKQLTANKITSLMLTGDSSVQGKHLAEQLHIDHCQTGCTPRQKAQLITELQTTASRVVMVGDGINDAPVFAAADISIAMGSGADITKYSADIVILRNNLTAITDLFDAAAKTRQTIKSNLLWSLVYNAVILPVAMMGFVAPYIAVIGMSASSILVVTHSLKLLKL